MKHRCRRARATSVRGFALIAVIGVVAVVTVISMELVRSIGLEAQGATSRLEALQLERIALAGHEVARYLEQRGLLVPGADADADTSLEALPVEAVSPGVYLIRFPEGTAEVRYGAENGKVSLASAPEPLLTAVFARWRGNEAEGRRLSNAVVDWRDPDRLTTDGNPESSEYPDAGFGPRNRGFGVGDAHLVAGFRAADFLPTVLDDRSGTDAWILPEGIYSLVTPLPTDGRVNPNFAPRPVLESVPGLDATAVRDLIESREQRLFADLSELERPGAIPPGSDAWNWLTLSTSPGRTVTVTAADGAGRRQVRTRVYESSLAIDPFSGQTISRLFLRRETRFDSDVRPAIRP